MKKVVITVAIALGVCVAIVGGYFYEAQASESHSVTKVNTTEKSNQNNQSNNTSTNQSNSKNINNNQIQSSTTQNSQTNNQNTNNSTTQSTTQSVNSNSGQSNVQGSNETTKNNINNSQSSGNSNSNGSVSQSNQTAANNAGQNTTNNGVIKVISPSMNINTPFPMNTVIVQNTTGNPISDSMLNSVIRNWILTWQFNSQGYYVAVGENWAPQWLEAIPNSALINAFIEANGKGALSQNITANEINKGAALYTKESYSKAYPFPFDQKQAEVYIQQMLNKDYPGNVIEKIVLHPAGKGLGGLYYVYTNTSEKYSSSNQPFWYVYSNTGQATGV